MSDESAQLEFREVNKDSWTDFEQLFESRGGPKWCWCMVWRDRPQTSSRKQGIEDFVRAGTPIGILGYKSGEPATWCSVAPRGTFRKGLSGTEFDDEVWSIVCFYIPSRLRGQGIAKQLLIAAIEHARVAGAKVVEAYPVAADSPSYLFMGFVEMFEKAGFVKVGRAGTCRHVMRLSV